MTTTATTAGRPPRRLLLATEAPRATAEFGAFVMASPLLRRAPRGDGHPVLVLPGFLADDVSTIALRRYLRGLGYDAHGWNLGRNIGPTEAIVEGMVDCLERLRDRHDRTVSVVGWSLGGMFARELARRQPAQVRQVVTLGSPFRTDPPIGSHASRRFSEYADRHIDESLLPPPETDRQPLQVPCTAVFTRADGIVTWQSCVQCEGPRAENIEVFGSHCGLGHNPAALWAVADRLAQPEGTWKPFRPPLLARHLFPTPARYQAAG